MSVDEILAELERLALPMVELTGGEPLAQAGARELLARLVDAGYKVLLETGGSESIAGLPKEVHVIMDLKCPASGMADRNLWENLGHLKPTDEIKFVLADRGDFDWALTKVKEHRLDERCELLFSTAFGLLKPKDLAEWMVAEKVKGRLQLQAHKYIWSPRAKGV